MVWTLLADSADLIVECTERSRALGLSLEPRLEASPLEALEDCTKTALALLRPLEARQILAAREQGAEALLILGGDPRLRELANDLGMFAPQDVHELVAGLSAMEFDEPWRASLRSLRATDRRRLAGAGLDGGEDGQLRLVQDGDWLALQYADEPPRALGHANEVRAALGALRSRGDTIPPMPAVEGLDSRAVMDVLLGPARALSDPASKQALGEYDVPLPEEVLCSSASRAASEATRIGFPVRVTLASPDLRAWDHPDLIAEGVDNAARVREIFRRFTQIAKERASESRVLGVVVSATTTASALLRVSCTSLGPGIASATVGFADPHGLAAKDETTLVLPCRYRLLEQRLRRLRGHKLFLAGPAAARRARVEEIADVLLRAAAFVDDWRAEVQELRLHTVALLTQGGAEVREACIVVSDAFTRSLGDGLA